MDLSILQQKELFPPLIRSKLASIDLDYVEKHGAIKKINKKKTFHLEASVVVLINYKTVGGNAEYVFQLIKRSAKVAQGGDISCPGGMLSPAIDNFLSCFLKTGIIPIMNRAWTEDLNLRDRKTCSLIQLYLTNALREAWEEIRLSPFNVSFLGALPSYSLTSFPRTIFPLVCLTHRPFKYKLNAEVEKVLEIPLSFFFESSNYAWLHVTTPEGENAYGEQSRFPCLVISDNDGNDDVLWGATLHIITNFLTVVSGGQLPTNIAGKKLKKIITKNYLSGSR
ncbi:MAG TPA: CoA pyrophosphatase [Smithellaceae bacterium]|nr:CoA pyrophosphatase [Smithellaceae bacterium]HOS10083.1 CoA pyrophosphatase [Smithellaceae bacterium]HPD50139.1 CoA pyrophosphatase [Smithellaceae bacterium]HPL50749.1 CoA pyrophosphatase [Smithellaceae bacterium]HPY35928.1 CoA pyrophosphatase [Smithellaceae bacterium]